MGLSGRPYLERHGKLVADANLYFPGSFDRAPRNPAEKINSGYKAWEFLLYFFGLGLCILYGVLPDAYWRHYCQLVRAFQLLMQYNILPDKLVEAHSATTKFSDGFENLYYQRRPDRLHFVHPSIHTPSHLAPETEQLGPCAIFSQWVIERTIGNLGKRSSNLSMHLQTLRNEGYAVAKLMH